MARVLTYDDIHISQIHIDYNARLARVDYEETTSAGNGAPVPKIAWFKQDQALDDVANLLFAVPPARLQEFGNIYTFVRTTLRGTLT